MTDESCGCNCTDCNLLDSHSCGREACGYTKHRIRTSKPVEPVQPAAAAVDGVRPELRAKFTSVRDPAAKARLAEWKAFCDETAGLAYEIREAKRRERYAEIFGEVMA